MDEDGWRTLTIGAVEFEAVKPCVRCVMTTIDQTTGLRPDKLEPPGHWRHGVAGWVPTSRSARTWFRWAEVGSRSATGS